MKAKSLVFDVFGREVAVVQSEFGWQVYYLGPDGKRRLADDIQIPAETAEADLIQALDDLCHEWATAKKNAVVPISS